jgi:hypothetical protein
MSLYFVTGLPWASLVKGSLLQCSALGTLVPSPSPLVILITQVPFGNHGFQLSSSSSANAVVSVQ